MIRPSEERLRGAAVAAGLLLIVISLSASGCASRISTKISSPYKADEAAKEEAKLHIKTVIKAIEERNFKVESNPEWKTKAYEQFMIKRLTSLDEGDYEKYARYLDGGAVYIIVHPAYYTFFNSDGAFPGPAPEFTGQDAMESFLSEASYSPKMTLMKAQEKRLRDFLEYMSTEKKLVILILPRKYEEFPAYRFRQSRDEYKLYINEATNESESVLYLYSRKSNRGTLAERDKRKLLKFLYEIKAKEVLIGGGFVGRCIEDFFKDIEQSFSDDRVFLVPEITAISPADVSSGVASDMLNSDGTINISKLSANIQGNVVGNQEIIPRIRNIAFPEGAP
ncbi:MAG: hypothetical protein M0Z71_15660 [Nitrospiraceae bacterium]|nr:hypothetical protein [Nitrospiraceae bacterium]